jgi:hypothetical protein
MDDSPGSMLLNHFHAHQGRATCTNFGRDLSSGLYYLEEVGRDQGYSSIALTAYCHLNSSSLELLNIPLIHID